MGTLDRVGVRQKVNMLGQLVLALVVVAGAWGQRCYLPNIPVQQNLDEVRFAGKWYELKWHAASAARLARWNGKYSDYAMVLAPRGYNMYNYMYYNYMHQPHHAHHPHMGFDFTSVYYNTMRGTCEKETGRLDRVDGSKVGKYYDTFKNTDFPGNQAWVMETDYTSYFIKFQCLKVVPGGYCDMSEVQIWARSPDYSRDVLRKAEIRVRELLANNECISYLYVIPVVPHSSPAKCAAELPSILPGVAPNLFNYFGNYFGSHHGMLGHLGLGAGIQSHPELIVPLKEQLIAEKAKLVSEKAYLMVLKEKVQLEIQRLRGHGGGAGPKV